MANNVNLQLQENPRLQRMPTDQREWHFFVNELAKWVADLDVKGRLTTDRIIPQVILSNAGSVQESLPIVATDAGASVTANISSHTLARQTGDVSYNAGAITGLSYDTTYYIYADDADYEGGSVTYLATTDKGDVVGSMGRYFIGEIITPAAGQPDRTGSPGAGAGVFNIDIFETGIKATNTADGIIKTSSSATVNTGTATDEAVTPEALANSDFIMLSDLYGITAAETTEGLVEANLNLQYKPGDILRYGTNTTPGTTDMTDALQTAIDVVYTAGGGTVYIPAGDYAITSVSRVFGAGDVAVNIQGEGKIASRLLKTGATTTPVIDFSAASLLTPAFSFSDFQIVGNAKGHDGIELTLLARLTLSRILISACDVALNAIGTLIFTTHDVVLNGNNIGYKCRKSGTVRCNLVQFFGGGMSNNTSFGVDIGDASGVHFYGSDIESNGTSADTSTGGVVIRDTVDDEFSASQISFNGAWFENNDGMTVKCEAATGLHLSFRNTLFSSSESGNVMDVAAIKHLYLEDVNAGGTGDTIISAATRTTIIGGVIYTYTDNSTTTYLGLATSANTGGFSTQASSANGTIANIGQSGPFAFISVASGVPTIGAFDYDAAATQPLNVFATHLQIPDYTDTELNDITDAVNTGAGKTNRAMVMNTTQGIAVFAAGNTDGAVWVDGAGTTVNTPV